jgi:hypothetical protein
MRGRPGKIPDGYEPVASDEADTEAGVAPPGPPNSAFELYEMGIDADAPPPPAGSRMHRPSASKSQPSPPGGATSRPKLSGQKKDKSKLMGYDSEFFNDVSTAAVNFSSSSKLYVFGRPIDVRTWCMYTIPVIAIGVIIVIIAHASAGSHQQPLPPLTHFQYSSAPPGCRTKEAISEARSAILRVQVHHGTAIAARSPRLRDRTVVLGPTLRVQTFCQGVGETKQCNEKCEKALFHYQRSASSRSIGRPPARPPARP